MTTRFGTTIADAVAAEDFPADYGSVAVLNYAGGAPLFVRVDGIPPTTAGEDGTKVVPAGARRIIDRSHLDGPTAVRMISTGAVSYEIEV